MAFVNLHTGVPSSPKHAPLSDAAFRLWTHALCWSKEHLTDGFIPSAMLPTLHPRGRKVVGELLAIVVPGKGPLWHETEGGYRVHDYSAWQETKDRVQERRQQWRDRQARTRETPKVVTPSVTVGVTRDTPVSHANPPSDGSGGGRGRGKKNPPTPKGEYTPDFERFWAAYPNGTDPDNPRRGGKADAFKFWRRTAPDGALIDRMLATVAWQRTTRDWTKDGGAYIPNVSTWLNKRRWEDDPPAAQKPLPPVDWQ